MKKVLWFATLLLTALLLAACGGETAPGEGMFPASDLSTVNSTGQPQFINAYANW